MKIGNHVMWSVAFLLIACGSVSESGQVDVRSCLNRCIIAKEATGCFDCTEEDASICQPACDEYDEHTYFPCIEECES